MTLKEYKPGTTFPGTIGLTADQSSPAWPEPLRVREGTPNVLCIVLDGTGYGQLGCYGSPIETPNLDSLAEGGLRYTNMHTTALCSPSRACIITGRNHHSNGMACITEGATGYPGYNGQVPFENGYLSEMLLTQGYNTYMVGKYHLIPSELESAAGPYDRWPLGRGFERSYGFLGGDTHQYYPDLVYDNHQVEPPRTPEEGYTLNEDLADKAIQFISDAMQVAPDKPFYLHYCPGATHAPHHVPKEWVDKYKGMFDDGWDVYREKVFAGFLTHTDYHIGRLLDNLKSTGKFDNTLIMVISDNGASSEGGPTGTTNELQFFNNAQESLQESLAKIDKLGEPETFNHYAWGWTFAGNTPFRRWKRETYRGGSSDPFIVHWPKGIQAKGEIRTQYAHIIDMVPTVLDALSIEPPAVIKGVTQSPIEGVSFAHSFDDASAPTRHITQYFEMFGHRALDHDGWRAVCPWPGPSFTETGRPFGVPISNETLSELDARGWELYHVTQDIAENNNIAADNRERLITMIATWYVEAGKYKVLPIDGSGVIRMATERPQVAKARSSYTYFQDTQTVPWFASAHVLNRPHSITADVEIPRGGAEGVLLCQGTDAGGLTCGANPCLPVTPEYASPFKFTGKIYGVTVDVSGDLIRDTEAEMRLVMARQ